MRAPLNTTKRTTICLLLSICLLAPGAVLAEPAEESQLRGWNLIEFVGEFLAKAGLVLDPGGFAETPPEDGTNSDSDTSANTTPTPEGEGLGGNI